MRPTTVVIGFGSTGEGSRELVAVVERCRERAGRDAEVGLLVVVGEATDVAVLYRAGVSHAEQVLVTCGEDATAVLIVARVRQLNTVALIVVALRDLDHAVAACATGADRVVAATQLVGGLLALSASWPDATVALLAGGLGERRPRQEEIGVRFGRVSRWCWPWSVPGSVTGETNPASVQ